MDMIFQIPNPLSMSIVKNVAFLLRLSLFQNKIYVEEIVKEVLKEALIYLDYCFLQTHIW
jgi:ABC-type phosphate transport system ATPase subunit